jgi:hypothetical protein
MHHNSLDGRGSIPHHVLDNVADALKLHGSATLVSNVLLETASLNLTVWNAVAGGSVTFTPAYSGTVLVTGQATVMQNTAGVHLYAGILHGATVVAQSVQLQDEANAGVGIPIFGTLAVVAGTAYTLVLNVKSTSDASNMAALGVGYTQFAVIQIPS